jgi:2-octaprenyl-6-methoxyphenol hydroxylase
MSDITLIGAGPLGLASALALHRRGLDVALVDARPAPGVQADARSLALSHGSRELLELLDAWPADATPITRIRVTQAGNRGEAWLSAAELHLPALGYVLPAEALAHSLWQRVQALGLSVRPATHVTRLQPEGKQIRLHEAAGSSFTSRLAVRCEGRIDAEADARQHDYAQHALLCHATPARPHAGLAHECFTSDGPIALLPEGEGYAVVWTVPSARLDTLLAADDAAWLAALNAALPAEAQLTALGGRAHYPLAMRLRKHTVAPRQVWLGNAAQTLHPVAGQGFNLALRDAWQLAELLTDAPDPGDARLLARYALARGLDRHSTAGFTDLLVRGFSSQLPLAAPLRGLGLSGLNALPPLRRFLARRMIWGARAWP